MPQVIKTLKILLIEDSLTDAVLLEKVFTRMSSFRFDLKRVALLKEGLNYLTKDSFDIVLLDLSLPDSSGLEPLQKIQEISKTVPIIVLTGTDNDDVATAALREGAQDYVVKDNTINSKVFSRLLQRSIAHSIERKQIMEQLRYKEALYRAVIEDQTEFICRFLPDGTIFLVNSSFSRYLDIDSNALLTQNFFLLIAEADLLLVSPSIQSLSPDIPNIIVEFRGKKGDSDCYWQQWNIRAIFRGQEIVEYQAVGQDISDLKEAETEKARLIASLHESREQFRLVTDNAPVLIWMTDIKGKPTFVNEFWLKFTGKSLEQALIEDWMINVYGSDRRKCQTTYYNALKNREYFDLEYRFLNHQGQYCWIFSTGVPRFNNQGQFVGFICSGVDISELKTAEKLLRQQADYNYTLAEITKHIHESLELEAVLTITTQEINRFFNTGTTTIAKANSAQYFQVLAQSTIIESESNLDTSSSFVPTYWQIKTHLIALKNQKIVAIQSKKEQNCFQTISLANFSLLENQASNSFQETLVEDCSIMLVPIIVEKKLWGVVGIEQFSVSRRWNEGEIKLLEQITRQLAIAIKQAELYQTVEETNKKLVELTVVDSLTRIANRRKFDEYLESEWKRLAREKAYLSLIMCDIDYFKLYNDTYGHQAGDRCLYQVAQAIKNTIKRPADLTARYGGEEIAVILPNTTPKGAEKVAKSICQQVQALHIPHINSAVDMYITLSVGVTGCIPESNDSVEELIAIADRNLYKAKKTGRNRVVLS